MSVAVVTGIQGFIGSRLADALRGRGWEVRGVDLAPGPDTTVGDITARGAWESALDGADLVVHTAAVVEEAGDRRRFERVNVGGTRNVLEAAADAGVDRAVHLSSIVVFGDDFPDGVDETAPVRMTGAPYTDTKVAAEHQALAVAANRRLPVTVVRPGDVYGPGSRPWTIRPLEMMRARVMPLPDGGRGILSPIHVDDLVDGVLAAATHPDAGGEIITITGGVGVTVRDFFTRYAEVTGTRFVSVPSGPLRAGMTAVAAGLGRMGIDVPLAPESVEYLTHPGTYSIAKAERLLGWRPSIDLDEGMRRTLAWAREAGLL